MNNSAKGSRQEGYPNLQRGGSSRRIHKKPVQQPGRVQTDIELKRDQSNWNSDKIFSSLVRWCVNVTSSNKKSNERAVLLCLIEHIGWNPVRTGYLQCENVTHQRIAQMVGCSIPSVERVTRKLKERGVLKWEYVHWKGKKQRKCCRYTLLVGGSVLDGDTRKLTEEDLNMLPDGYPFRRKSTTHHSPGGEKELPITPIGETSSTTHHSNRGLPITPIGPRARELSSSCSSKKTSIKPQNGINAEKRSSKMENDSHQKTTDRELLKTPRFEDLPIEQQMYVNQVRVYFDMAVDRTGVYRPIDYAGTEVWMWNVLLRNPRLVLDKLYSAKQQIGGKDLFRGLINNVCKEIEENEIAEIKWTPEQLAENRRRFNQIVTDAFSGSKPPKPKPALKSTKLDSDRAPDDPMVIEYAEHLARIRHIPFERAYKQALIKLGIVK